MDKEKILIVEDDVDINNLIDMTLKKDKYEVIQAFSGSEAKLRLAMDNFDMVLLDLMIPGITGEELIKEIRETLDIPVIIISAKNALEDKINLLNIGADDYITKPFQYEELSARVNSHLRRSRKYQQRNEKEGKIYKFKELTLEEEAREVKVKGEVINLTSHEFEILKVLIENPDKVYSREVLYEKVWDNGYYGEDNSVNVHVSNIRKKFKEVIPNEEYIKTVWGIGFKMSKK